MAKKQAYTNETITQLKGDVYKRQDYHKTGERDAEKMDWLCGFSVASNCLSESSEETVHRSTGNRKQRLVGRLSNTKSSKFSYRSCWSDSHTIRGIGMRDKKSPFEITKPNE